MLTSNQREFYSENGFVHVKGLLTRREAECLRAETHALAERLGAIKNIESTWGSASALANGQTTRLLHCHDVQFQSAMFSRLIVDERLTGVAADIIGPNVQLHHTKMFIKPPENGSPFPMHQDAPFFPHARHSMIAAIIHFDDAPIEKGCLRVVPGSYKLGMLPHIEAGNWHLPDSEYPVEGALPIPAEAGDAILFSYLTIHGSGLNTGSEARTTLLVQMRDPEDPPTIKTHESRGQGMMLRGIDPTCGVVPAHRDGSASDPSMGAAMGSAMASG